MPRYRIRAPKIMIRARDLIEEYGLTEGAAYELLHAHGIKLDGGYYIKRVKADEILNGANKGA